MPPAAPPTEAELRALAEQALEHAGGGEAQATAWWERMLQASGGAHLERAVTSVEVLVVIDGRPGVAVTSGLEAADLLGAAGQAREAAERAPHTGMTLPPPAPGRAHAGYDPALAGRDPTELVADGRRWRAGAARTVILSTRGVSAYEQRSFAALTVDAGASAELSVAAIAPSGVDAEALVHESRALSEAREPAGLPAGEVPVVLGPDAVASVLDRLRPQLCEGGGLEARRGSRVAASCVNLSESPRFSATLPRSYDAMGAPRHPIPLIQDGVAHRVVSRDTGHAVAAGSPAARPDHLVLVGGGAADEAELMAPIARGVYLPTLDIGFEILDGRRARPLVPFRARVDGLRVLATTQALSARQRTIAVGDSARTIGATVCPALRATGGVEWPRAT